MFDDIIDVDLKTAGNRILHESYGLIWLWKHTKYEKIAFLENSVVVLNKTDDIFNQTPLAAIPDVGWADKFDTNVMLLQPNKKIFNKLRKAADKEVRNEREGQDSAKVEWLITSIYPDWNRLPCIYNIHYTLQDTNRDAYRRLQHTIKIVRFTGENKPWTVPLNIDNNLPEVYIDKVGHIYIELLFHEKWWNVFTKYVHAKLKKYLKKYNLHLVIKDRHLFLGNVDFHVDAGFFNLKGKSCPKMIVKNNRTVSNQYSSWRQLLEGIRGWQDVGLEL
ncbi:hypothetical protein LOTGIDRAFT_164406 [Lottia gigantea]|uniref:Uncharacterized protein n=1 Tax=Lottia gigantea TaxID=225164 RepID=V4A519_LOTGI|nr:hypothetical protein LOTGIDRAFT_164406 [Lottia gigantea]ESO90100.1 hypothetical protein LOTGIDRAFT_164406 [Lottia gigantea]